MLCEVSYHHQSLCGKVAEKSFEYLPKCSEPSEHYAVLRYLATIICAVGILDKLKEMLDVNGREDMHQRRGDSFLLLVGQDIHSTLSPGEIWGIGRALEGCFFSRV
jgi:hypothetical protein